VVGLASNEHEIDDGTGFNRAIMLRHLPSCIAHFNGDGFVDFTDFEVIVTIFESGC
jgi:hypothetical protein